VTSERVISVAAIKANKLKVMESEGTRKVEYAQGRKHGLKVGGRWVEGHE